MKAWTAPDLPVVPVVPGRPRLFDTAAADVVEIGPDTGPVRMYVCGITPYDATHLGHANTYVAFDLIQRTLRDCGFPVIYAQNVTDVDDPLLERAAATGVDWEELAAGQVELFRQDMTALRVIPPDDFVGVVESLDEVTQVIEMLQWSGVVYRVDDPEYPDWYFDVESVPGFGRVSHLDAAQQLALSAERGGDPQRRGKRSPLDCLVWRLARPGEPAWDSPLGRGRPGWHVECTAIVLRFLGGAIDIQGGGSDLAFPHHEMCAAEGEVALGIPFAKAFVHSGMVGLGGEKMSKSKGNLVLVSRLLESGADPMAIRLALLAHHYRSDWEWTPELLADAEARLGTWREAVARPAGAPSGDVLARVRALLRDDLRVPEALTVLDDWARASATDATDAAAPAELAAFADAVLGVRLR